MTRESEASKMKTVFEVMAKTRHKSDCARVFSRYDVSCPRCQELKAGLKPRAGWGDFKRAAEAQFIAEVRAHNCKASNCGPVCTFGDW